MTDKEIIKALECCACGSCTNCPLRNCTDCHRTIIKQCFEIYNRQQAEIESFKSRQKPTGTSGYKIENGKVVFFTNILDGYRHEYKDLEEVVKTLNELLREAYSKDEILFHYRCARADFKTAKFEAIKEFAERFKNIAGTYQRDTYVIGVDEFDNLVKEMVGD